MHNPWKVTTIGLVVTGVTALTSGLTTAYFLRAGSPAVVDGERAPASLAGVKTMTEVDEPRRPPIVRIARTAPVAPARPVAYEPADVPARVASAPATAAPAASVATPRTEPVAASAPVASAPRPEPVVASTSTASAPADCATGGDRAWRVAKPGALGTLVGAGVGAVGGAIADGGKGAGKGALWGGLAGAVVGTGWGAYKTKQECGTIFGDSTTTPGAVRSAGTATAPATSNVPQPIASGGATTEAPFAPRSNTSGSGITIYDAR